MNVLIIFPDNEPRLGHIASIVKEQLLKTFKQIVVDITSLDNLQTPAPLEQHDVIMIGTPTIKEDIYWPLQVAIDGLMHRIPREQIASKIATGFAISDSIPDSARNLEAVLWVFTESNARIIKPLILQDGASEEQVTAQIRDFIHGLREYIA